MRKQPYVTSEDLEALASDLDNAVSAAKNMGDRIRSGYVDVGAATTRRATDMLNASRALADLSAQLLFWIRHEEDMRRIAAENDR